ncbi:MAG: LysM peptidoglycan-binding domain-containing protein, partial [Deltaproteobacteria bacterium]|nr:LysM peptidoglycan-binding domain-containing protein [Deltaproteobacteria bacterium]
PALREPVFKGTKYIPADYLLQLPVRFKTNGLLSGAPSSLFRAEQKRSKFYQVRSGDTASVIAKAHNISLNSLIKANNLNPQAFLRIGQNLRIPSSANGSPSLIRPVRYDSQGLVLSGSKKSSPVVLKQVIEQDSAVIGNLKVSDIRRTNNLLSGAIEVQPDESIRIFADWLKATPESIRLTNTIAPNQDIHPGQKITLEFLNVSIEDFEANRFDYHQETQEDFFSSYNIVGITSYKVVEGDTIWDICRKKFDLPLWLLKKYNDDLNFNHLTLSSSLQIPIVSEI